MQQKNVEHCGVTNIIMFSNGHFDEILCVRWEKTKKN